MVLLFLTILLVVCVVYMVFSVWKWHRLQQLGKSIQVFSDYWQRQNNNYDDGIDLDNKNNVYLAIGDDFTQSIGASHPTHGFVTPISKLLQIKFNNGRPVEIQNRSWTDAYMCHLLVDNIHGRAIQNRIRWVTVTIASNDVMAPNTTFDDHEFESQLQKHLHTLCAWLPRGCVIVIADIPFMCLSEHSPWLRDRIQRANAILHRIVTTVSEDPTVTDRQQNLKIADVYLHTKAQHIGNSYSLCRVLMHRFKVSFTCYSHSSVDLIHPNSNGYRAWTQAFQSKFIGDS